MTVSNTISRMPPYSGDGNVLVFPYDFKIFAATDLVVILTTAGVDVVLVLTIDYAVSGVGNSNGGAITMAVAPSSGTTLNIRRILPLTQEADYRDGDSFPADAHENAMDRQTMISQQLNEHLGRALSLSPRSTLGDVTLPDPEDGKVLVGNSTNDGYVNADIQVGNLPTTGMNTAGFVKNSAGGVLQGGQPLPNASEVGAGIVEMATVAEVLTGTDTARAVTPAGVQAKIPAVVPVRQTALGSPVDTAGLPTFLPATSASRNLTTHNLATGNPLVVTAAKGAGLNGGLNVVGQATVDFTWTNLTANRAAATPNYLYVVINADGTLTTGFTLLAPIYQWGCTPAITNGQFTFNIQQMTGYLGNGTTAPQANVVFLGEAATNGTTVISTVTYALMGRYESSNITPLPETTTLVTLTSNLGMVPQVVTLKAECTSADYGFAVGDVSANLSTCTQNIYLPLSLFSTKKTVGFITGQNYGVCALDKSSAAVAVLTVAKWAYRINAQRGW